MNKVVPIIMLLLLGVTSAIAQNKLGDTVDKCYRWRTQVDPSKQRIVKDQKSLTDREIEEGIGCLLELKGQKHKGRFYGDTRINLYKSEGYRPPKNPATPLCQCM